MNVRRALTLGLPLSLIALSACGGSKGEDHPDAGLEDAGPETVAFAVHARPGPGSVDLSWEETGAAAFHLYHSTDPACDPRNVDSCEGGGSEADVSSPHRVTGLEDGRHHFFWVVGDGADGARYVGEGSARPDAIDFDASVDAIATAPWGDLVVGGTFSAAGIPTGSLGVCLRRGAAGTVPCPAVESGGSGYVYAVEPDGDGGFYVGGYFSSVGGEPRENLAHVLADGSVGEWRPAFDADVYAIARVDDTIYVGGEFTEVDGEPRAGIAAFAADGSLLEWAPEATGGAAFAFAHDGERLFVGGYFNEVNGEPRGGLASFDSEGSLESWAPETEPWIVELHLFEGKLYAGGYFNEVGGEPRNGVAAFEADGALSDWAPIVEGGQVVALVSRGGRLYAGGGFTAVDGEPRPGLAAFGAGGELAEWTPELPDGAWVESLDADDAGVVVGGYFGYPGEPLSNFAFLDPEGARQPHGTRLSSSVYEVAILGDRVFVGGELRLMELETRHRLAALGADGRLTGFAPELDRAVDAFEVIGETLYVGGRFTSVSGEPRGRLAAFGAEGTLLDFSPGVDGRVHALGEWGGGLLVGGEFQEVAGEPRERFAAFDAEGALTAFAPGFNRQVRAFATAEGQLFVGGSFSVAGISSRPGLASFDEDGNLTGFDPDISGDVHQIATFDGALFIGGAMSHYSTEDDQSHRYLLRFDEALDLSWPWSVDHRVYALHVDESTMYVGGAFGSVNDQVRAGAAALGEGGALLEWSAGDLARVNAIWAHAGRIYLAGTLSNGRALMSVAPAR